MNSLSLKRLVRKAGLFLLAMPLLWGCATYQSKVGASRELLKQGQTKEAVELLEPLAKKDDGDQLVYLLDYATAQQIAGETADSNQSFLKADKLAEQLDYQSVSRVAGSLLLSEEMKQYKGDTFEKIFINAQLAINYLQLGNLDDALVEARRINEKYVKLRSEDKKKFELNPFAKYLSAVIWEADRQYDDAIIAYEEAYKLSPQIATLPEDLIRVSKLSRRDDDYKDWKKEFPEVKERPEWYDKSKGELVILIQQGWGPRKVFSRTDARFPALSPVFSETHKVRAEINDVGNFESRFVYDVQTAAINTLEDDRLSLLGRRLAGMATKAVAADQLRQKSPILGFIAWFALNASDRADLRQWSTLPQSIQVIRVFLKPGDYVMNLQGLAADESPTGDRLEQKRFSIRAGRKAFYVWRTLR